MENEGRRRNITTACARCRNRKAKCDGVRPTCGTCAIVGRGCDYSSSVDGRTRNRPHLRIMELERQVEQLKKQIASSPPVSQLETPERLQQKSSSVERTQTISTSYKAADSLQLHPRTGDLTFFGPTSVPFRIPTAPQPHIGVKWLPRPRLDISSTPVNGLTREVHDELVDLYFSQLNGLSAFVDEGAFRYGMTNNSESVQIIPGYSSFLHFAILALASHLHPGCQRGQPHQLQPEHRGLHHFEQALEMLELELERPQPTTVLGLVILCTWLADAGKFSFAWIYSGIAVRVAQDLGLHVDTSALVAQGALPADGARLRDDAFWTIYVHDKLLALYIGRAPGLREGDYDLLPPPIVDDLNLSPACRHLRGVQAALIGLCDAFSKIMQLLYSVRRDRKLSKESFDQISADLASWHASLDPSIRLAAFPLISNPNSIVLHALHETAVILVNQASLQQHCLESTEGKACFEAALNTLHLAGTFDLHYSIRKAPITMSQILYVASSVLYLILQNIPDIPECLVQRDQCRAAIDELRRLLSSFAETWGAAKQSLDALDRAYRGATDVVSDDATAWMNDLFDWPSLAEISTLHGFTFQ